MADKAAEKVDVVAKKDEPKEKEVVDSPKKDDIVEEEKVDQENGDVCEEKNGKTESEDAVDAKEDSEACPVKRKSTGGDAAENTPAEGVSPEKKAKLSEPADAEPNGKAEVAA